MRWQYGQATIHVGHTVRRAIGVVLALVLIGVVSLATLGWRLSEGPLDITWLARQVAAQTAPEPSPGVAGMHIQIGAAALAWEGWRGGLDRPLDLRLDHIAAYGADGATVAVIPQARVSLSLAGLLLGRLVPRAVEIDGARLNAVRAPDGRISTVLGSVATIPGGGAPGEGDLGPDPFGALLRELARPAQTDASSGATQGGIDSLRWRQLRRVRISDTVLTLADHQLGVVWVAPQAMLDLRRGPDGGVSGVAEMTLAVGNQSTQVSATAQLATGVSGGAVTSVHARFSALAPAAVARLSPDLASLEAVDAPVDGGVELALDAKFDIARAHFELRMGSGSVRLGEGSVPVAGGNVTFDADRQGLTLSAAQVAMAGAGAPVLRAAGTLRKAAPGYAARASLDIDQVAFAALAQYWPRGVASGARGWITTNITAGTARAAHADLALSFGGGQALQVTAASGQLTGDDLTVAWLRPIPPVEHAQATLTIVSPDELLINITGGHQLGGAVRVGPGTVRITGLAQKDQACAIDLALSGPVADAWALLHQPRLNVLSRHPVEVGDPTGQLAGRLTLSLPLDNKATTDQLAIHSQGQLSDVHLQVAGRSLDHGNFDFDVTGDGLKMSGPAKLVTIPAQLGLQMDFRTGPPQQVQTRLTAAGEATTAQLDAAGLDSNGLLSGSATLAATLEERRDGSGQVSVHADLAHTGIGVRAFGWRHEAGGTASGDVGIVLDHDRIVGIDHLVMEGPGISVLGHADYADAGPSTLHLEHLVLGDTRAAGTIRFTRPGIRVELSGPSLDLSGRFAAHRPQAEKAAEKAAGKAPDAEEKGPPWSVDLHFDQVLMAGRRRLSAVSVVAEHDGLVLRRAHLAGRTGADERFSLSVAPDSGGRRLHAEAADAGALLAAADVLQGMEGGRAHVSGQFDDARADHQLTGNAEINDFRLRHAPVAAKLLQAMTLYGLVDALDGPGLGVSQMIVPFHYGADILSLSEVRAFSASLGATVKGEVDFADDTLALQGTIVPAYFFNTLLGGLPVVGRLFSPEKGGGVFAATYTVRGPIDDPSVEVNPLAALTPGFLRGLFGIFGK